MLLGEYHYILDNKGRLTIPSKLRTLLGDNIIITRGLDNSLFLYKEETFKNKINTYEDLPNKKTKRDFLRLFLSGALTQTFDKQGRINIPDYLLNYAKITKNTVIIGVGDRLEIWDENTWNKFKEDNLDNMTENLDKLFENA